MRFGIKKSMKIGVYIGSFLYRSGCVYGLVSHIQYSEPYLLSLGFKANWIDWQKGNHRRVDDKIPSVVGCPVCCFKRR